MGILLKNDEKNVSMGYITFGIIRQQIAKSYDYKIGELYSKLYNPLFKGYSNEENKYFIYCFDSRLMFDKIDKNIIIPMFNEGTALDTLYDLIKADLVEKVEDK